MIHTDTASRVKKKRMGQKNGVTETGNIALRQCCLNSSHLNKQTNPSCMHLILISVCLQLTIFPITTEIFLKRHVSHTKKWSVDYE